MLLVLHGAFARCALLAQPAIPSGSALSPPHTCAGVPLPCLTVAFIAVPAVSPPLRAPTMRGKSPPRPCLPRRWPSVSDGSACAQWAHAASAPLRVPYNYFHATSRPPSPCQGQGLRLLVYCAAACRGAMHPPSLCRVCNTTLAAFSTIFEGGSGRLCVSLGEGPQSKPESLLITSRRSSTTSTLCATLHVPRPAYASSCMRCVCAALAVVPHFAPLRYFNARSWH